MKSWHDEISEMRLMMILICSDISHDLISTIKIKENRKKLIL